MFIDFLIFYFYFFNHDFYYIFIIFNDYGGKIIFSQTSIFFRF